MIPFSGAFTSEIKESPSRLSEADSSCDRLDDIFAEMKAYRIPEGDRDLFEKLRSAAGKFEYDRILELLKDQ